MAGNSGFSQVKDHKTNELELDLEGSLGGATGINCGRPNFDIIVSEAIKVCLSNSHILSNTETVTREDDQHIKRIT